MDVTSIAQSITSSVLELLPNATASVEPFDCDTGKFVTFQMKIKLPSW